MPDNQQKAVPFFTRYLEVELCEDLSEQEMNQVQGGLKIAKRPYHDLDEHYPIKPIRPIKPIHPIQPIHPIEPPVGHPIPKPLPHPHPIFTSKLTDLYEPTLPVDSAH